MAETYADGSLPSLSTEDEEQLDRIVDEILQANRLGFERGEEFFIKIYPKFAPFLREFYSTLVMVDKVNQTVSECPGFENGALEHPSHLGDFELMHEIGRGGMGAVGLRNRQLYWHADAIAPQGRSCHIPARAKTA